MKLQLGNCDAECSDGEASNKVPQRNGDCQGLRLEFLRARGFLFLLCVRLAQFDVPANKRFWSSHTTSCHTNAAEYVGSLEVVQLCSATVGLARAK